MDYIYSIETRKEQKLKKNASDGKEITIFCGHLSGSLLMFVYHRYRMLHESETPLLAGTLGCGSINWILQLVWYHFDVILITVEIFGVRILCGRSIQRIIIIWHRSKVTGGLRLVKHPIASSLMNRDSWNPSRHYALKKDAWSTHSESLPRNSFILEVSFIKLFSKSPGWISSPSRFETGVSN